MNGVQHIMVAPDFFLIAVAMSLIEKLIWQTEVLGNGYMPAERTIG